MSHAIGFVMLSSCCTPAHIGASCCWRGCRDSFGLFLLMCHLLIRDRCVRSGRDPGANGPGVVSIGTRTLSESGTVGAWRREQVELFCISKLINCMLESDEEFICMDFHFATGGRCSLPSTLMPLLTTLGSGTSFNAVLGRGPKACPW